MSDVTSVAATTYPVSTSDIRSHVYAGTTADDTYLTNLVAAATDYCERRTNRCFITQTRVLKMRDFDDKRYVHDGEFGERQIRLPRGPLATVSSITYVDSSGTTATLGTSIYTISTGDQAPLIFESYNEDWPDTRSVPNNVTITYTCGYGTTQSNVPDRVKHAIRLLVGHWYRNREAVEVANVVPRKVPVAVDALLGVEETPSYG